VKRSLLFILLLGAVSAAHAQETLTDTIRYSTYNLLNFENEAGNHRSVYFRTIMNELQPDLLTVQELIELPAAQMFLDSVMLPTSPVYNLATFISSYDTDRGLYYNSEQFEFLDAEAIDTELRDINQFHLRHTASGQEFYLFTLHLKATSGDDAQRAREVDSLRKVTDLIPDSIPFIVSGDFNIYDENEPAYNGLLDTAGGGYFIDPLQDSLSTFWNNSGNAAYHTQSTRVRNFDGGSTGGLDDRFDMILFSSAIDAPGGMDYVFGSTVAFGNDGNHYNDSINAMPNTAVTEEVANALHLASDHLPLKVLFTMTWTEEEDTTIVDTTTNSIPDLHSLFRVYPSPANTFIHVASEHYPAELLLMDMQGHMILQTTTDSRDFVLELPGLSDGNYLMLWRYGQRSYMRTLPVIH